MAVDKVRGKRLPGRSEEPSSDPADPAMAEAAAAGHPKSSTEEQKERDRFARNRLRPRRRSVEDALDQGERRGSRGDRDSEFEGEPPAEEERPLGEGNDGFESLHAAKRPILADSGSPSPEVSKAPPPVPEPLAEVLGEIAPTHEDPDPERSAPGAGPAEVLEDLVAPPPELAEDDTAEVIASVTSPQRNFPPPERPRPILPPPPIPRPRDASPLAPLPPRLPPPILPPPPRPPAAEPPGARDSPQATARIRREVRAAMPAVTAKPLGENPAGTEAAATVPELRAVDPDPLTTTLIEIPKISLDEEGEDQDE